MNNVFSLCHLTCTRFVTSLLNNLEVHNISRIYQGAIRRKVEESITRLIPCTSLQKKVKKFIHPLLNEILEFLDVFDSCCYGSNSVRLAIWESIPHCWRSDGTIDREKSAKMIVNSTTLGPTDRFVVACTYCFYDEVLEQWTKLFKIEKAYLRNKSSPLVKLWIEWLESDSIRDRESFFAWSLGFPAWHFNVSIMKHALQTLSPAERSRYLLNAVIGKQISPDVLCFCISVMTKEEQEQLFKSSTLDVFRCMLSWPLRITFSDTLYILWPHFTTQSFCDALQMILHLVKEDDSDYMDLIIVLKIFWNQSPPSFQYAAKANSSLVKPLEFILDFHISHVFSGRKFRECFHEDFDQYLTETMPVSRRQRQLAARRRYTSL